MRELVLSDLSRSGITPSDINALPLGVPERSALDVPQGVPGFVIPYFDINGLPTPFYRARLFDFAQKYRQPRGSGNQVYFPQNFRTVLNGHKYVIITEGEKKAAAATARGYPTVSLGGVYSWRNKTIMLPDTAVVQQGGRLTKGGSPVDLEVGKAQRLQIRLPEEFDADRLMSEYAAGFEPLINLVKERDLTVLICFDSEEDGTLQHDIQKAAARLAMELRFMGVPFINIRQLILPNPKPDYHIGKVGLDDYLATASYIEFETLLEAAQSEGGFPRHPNMHVFISKKLQNSRVSRKEINLIGLSIIADLDSRGLRLRSRDGLMYYFNRQNKQLIRASAPNGRGPVLLDDSFQTLLYTRYSITNNDQKVQRQVAAQYTAEAPIQEVTPRHRQFVKDDTIYFQITNSQFVTCNATHPCRIHDNGTLNTLFQSQMDEDSGPEGGQLNPTKLQEEVAKQLKTYAATGRLPHWWFDTMKQTRLKGLQESDKPARLISLLYYISPWLFRWRNTQLPVEIATGEAGSGKSTLYSLRQQILYGSTDLKNTPNSIRDWQASVASGGGLHVIDNMNLTINKALKQELSDEMCRIVTDSKPTIEMRKFYTEHELVKVPVNAVFAMTAIQLPFHQSDLIQRSIHIELDKSVAGVQGVMYDAEWASHQVHMRGGREAWVAHHLVALHIFFKTVESSWNLNYKARYRLINFEQALMVMASVFGWAYDWIPGHLTESTGTTVVGADWVLEGLKAFVEEHREAAISSNKNPSLLLFTAGDISMWAQTESDFQDCIPMINSRKLGRYLIQHKTIVAQVTGLKEKGTRQNKIVYGI